MPRVRRVYPTDELCHRWAHDHSVNLRNKQGNVFSEGMKIFSYGYHFPMAKKVPGRDGRIGFLVNPNTYSNTTNRHQSDVKSAITGVGPRFDIPVDLWRSVHWRCHGEDIRQYYISRLNECIFEMNNKRMGWWRRNQAVIRARDLHETFYEMSKFYSFRIRRVLPEVEEPDLTESKIKYDTRREANEIARRKRWKEWDTQYAKKRLKSKIRERELRETLEDRIAKWKHGGRCSTELFPGVMLRINGDKIETTLGARVTIAEAIDFLEHELPKAIKNRGQEMWDMRVGIYRGVTAKEEHLKIGCHRIPWPEVWRLRDLIAPENS